MVSDEEKLMDDKIKWALLAVGAYFLYDWYTGQVAVAAAAALAPGGGAGVGTGTDRKSVV